MRRVGVALATGVVAALVSAGSISTASPAPLLGPIVRVQTPGTAGCHSESETAVAVSAVGTWVAYNDIGICQAGDRATGSRITTLQLLPVSGGPARVITLPVSENADGYEGDPALAVDTDGRGVVLASLSGNNTPQASAADIGVSSATLWVDVIRISADGVARRLPPLHQGYSFADKEAVAVDRSPSSPRRGWVYVAWDEAATSQVVLQAFDGKQWRPRVKIADGSGRPDVAIGPQGQVAVAYERSDGVAVRVTPLGSLALGPEISAIRGSDPGHADPACPLINSVGLRQRAIKSPRLAWDDRGGLHVVAAVNSADLAVTPTAAGTTPESSVVHAVSLDAGRRWTPSVVSKGSAWAPSIAALDHGRVAIGYLELADAAGQTSRAWVWRTGGGRVEVSQGASAQELGSESQGTNYCYGLGDYTGIAAWHGAATYAWASTAGAARPAYDTDVLVRRVSGS